MNVSGAFVDEAKGTDRRRRDDIDLGLEDFGFKASSRSLLNSRGSTPRTVRVELERDELERDELERVELERVERERDERERIGVVISGARSFSGSDKGGELCAAAVLGREGRDLARTLRIIGASSASSIRLTDGRR